MKSLLTLVNRLLKTGRSREGAWIEILANKLAAESYNDVAPARERGLKYRYNDGADADRQSLPRGSVD